jgi:hypothetical protein
MLTLTCRGVINETRIETSKRLTKEKQGPTEALLRGDFWTSIGTTWPRGGLAQRRPDYWRKYRRKFSSHTEESDWWI